MSLLGGEKSARSTRPVLDTIYNAGYVGSITPGEIAAVKAGDRDRATGAKLCSFCRLPKPLVTGNGTTCDAYCEAQEFAWIPWGRHYPSDNDKGREWTSL